jgi:septum formation protein
MIDLPKLVLASGSPRRAEILGAVGWPFEKRVADIDETAFENEPPADYVVRLAREKAEAVAKTVTDDKIVLGADTTVVIDNEIIGKPIDLDDARRMLRGLSGRVHEVLTGVAIVGNGTVATGLEQTRVEFNQMSADEIEFLTMNGAPLDKAGAYAVQAQAALFIKGIEGDYWNVVGLPVGLVYRLVTEMKKARTLPSSP